MGFYRNGIIMDDSSGHPESYTQTFLAHHILLVFVCLTCEPSQLFYTTWSREAKMWDTHNLDNFSQYIMYLKLYLSTLFLPLIIFLFSPS